MTMMWSRSRTADENATITTYVMAGAQASCETLCCTACESIAPTTSIAPGERELRHAPTLPGAVCALADRVEGTNFRHGKIAKGGSTQHGAAKPDLDDPQDLLGAACEVALAAGMARINCRHETARWPQPNSPVSGVSVLG